MTIWKLLGISSIVLFFLWLFFAVNKIHASYPEWIMVDVWIQDSWPLEWVIVWYENGMDGTTLWYEISDSNWYLQIPVDPNIEWYIIKQDCGDLYNKYPDIWCDKSTLEVYVWDDYLSYNYGDVDLWHYYEWDFDYNWDDDYYIFNNKKWDDKCVKIQTKVKSKVGNENFKFDLRDRRWSVIESRYSDENGEVEWSLCDGADSRYFITQDCESLTHNGLLCDWSIVTVNINGESVEYHYDYYDWNMYDKIHPCFARNDEWEAVWW